MLAAAAFSLAVACIPESADLHPNHRELPDEPDVDPEVVTDELGTLAIQLADYQQLGIKIKSIDISGNNGEQISGLPVPGASGVSVSAGASGNITVNYSTPVDIKWVAPKTPWTGETPTAKDFSVQMTAATYEKGLTFKIMDDKNRVFKYVYDKMVTVEEEEADTLACLPVTLYYGTANCVIAQPKAGNVEIDVTPHVSFSTALTPDGGDVLDAEGNILADAKGTSIVWQQGETGVDGDVIGTPTLSGNTLKVPTTGKKGNAVVAIKDAAGTILWSYLIWVSEVNDVECSFPDKYGDFTLLDRNIGATTTEPKNQDSYGNFYQWGRKDALKRIHNIERGADRTVVVECSGFEHELTTETVGTIANSIQNPAVRFMTTAALKDWHFSYRVQPLWGNINASSSPVKASVKTVYDPCPEGYQIPEKEVYSCFTLNDAEHFNENYGFKYPTGKGDNTIFFPANGIVQHTSTSLQYHEYEGFVWSNNPGSGGVYIIRFGINTNAGVVKSAVAAMDRAYACGVRCIKTSSIK